MDGYNAYVASVTGGNIQRAQLDASVYESLTYEGREAIALTSQFVAPITNNYHLMRDYAVQQTSTLVNPFEIYPIINMEVIPFTNMAMARWINAQPQVRRTYLETNEPLLGYIPDLSDRSEGINNYDYRRSHDGVVVHENGHYLHRNFYEHIREESDRLSIDDRISIQRTYAFIAEAIDTDVWIDAEDDIIYY